MHRSTVSRRCPPAASACRVAPPAALCAIPSPPARTDTLTARLEALLNRLPTYIHDIQHAASSTLSHTPSQARRLFSKEGPLGLLQFWRLNRDNARRATDAVLDAGEAAARGDTDAFRRAAHRFNLRWLRWPSRQPDRAPPPLAPAPASSESDLSPVQVARNVALAALDALTPWDFDRRDFDLTFAHVWVDTDAFPPDTRPNVTAPPLVKLASTIKPLHGEWKLTARTRLAELGEHGVVFGKAGMYLAGEHPPFIGVEADRMWSLPRLDSTFFFANVNYRSSRKPERDPVRCTAGLQHDFLLFGGLVLTLRVGVDPMVPNKLFVTPVPGGSYF